MKKVQTIHNLEREEDVIITRKVEERKRRVEEGEWRREREREREREKERGGVKIHRQRF
jgi:hypothetical protein